MRVDTWGNERRDLVVTMKNESTRETPRLPSSKCR
jgi:hypothetical protein